jgi:NADPH:quinone reductase
MKAVYISEFGRTENLEVREVPDPPKPDGNDVIVRVHAAGVNRADLIQLRGHYPPPPGYSPNIPGLEFAGEVVDAGKQGVVRPGARVFGITADEAQAEFIKIDHRLLAHIPDRLNYTEAAAVPEAFITAYDAVFSQADLKGEETLLIHAVGSGVGLAALQIAKHWGHHVIGTSRTAEKLERCNDLGLDEGIVVGTPPAFAGRVMASGRGADVVLDLVGGAYLQENLKALASQGCLMLVGLTSGAKAEFDLSLALSKRLRLIGTVLRARSLDEKASVTRAFETDVVPMLASGSVKPNVDRVFDIEDARSAYEYLGSNESFGKVVLEIR